jgi:hypothetical protein
LIIYDSKDRDEIIKFKMDILTTTERLVLDLEEIMTVWVPSRYPSASDADRLDLASLHIFASDRVSDLGIIVTTEVDTVLFRRHGWTIVRYKVPGRCDMRIRDLERIVRHAYSNLPVKYGSNTDLTEMSHVLGEIMSLSVPEVALREGMKWRNTEDSILRKITKVGGNTANVFRELMHSFCTGYVRFAMGDRGEDFTACLRVGLDAPHSLNIKAYNGEYNITGKIEQPSLPLVGVDEEIVGKLQAVCGREEILFNGTSTLIIAPPNAGKSTSANVYGMFDYDELYSAMVGWPDGAWFDDPKKTRQVEQQQIKSMAMMMSLGVRIIGMPTMPAIRHVMREYPTHVYKTEVTWRQVLAKSITRIRRPNYTDRDALRKTFDDIALLNLPIFRVSEHLTPFSVSDKCATLVRPGRTMLYPKRKEFSRRAMDDVFPAVLVDGISKSVVDIDGMPPVQTHDGQRKIFIGLLYFLSRVAKTGDIVHIAGSAPGLHLNDLAKMFDGISFVCYDPNPTLISRRRENVTVVKDVYTPSHCDLFVNDIRADGFSEMDVDDDNKANAEYLSANGARAAWLKYRPSGDKEASQLRIPGEVIFQAWNRVDSGEARILWEKKLGLMLMRQDAEAHWSKMRDMNASRPALDLRAEAIAYATYMRSLFYDMNAIMVSCFAYCGVQNGDVYRNLAQSGNLMFNFPNVHVARRWDDGVDDIWFWTKYCVFAIRLGNRTVYVKWRHGNYTFHKPDRKKEILLSVKTRSNRVDLFGYWISATNIVPRRDTKRRDWVYADKDGPGLDITFSSGPENAHVPVGGPVLYNFLVKEASNNIWLDYCLDPGMVGRLGFRVKWLPELAVAAQAASFVDTTHPISHLWVCGIKGSKFEWDPFQTRLNTQTAMSAKGAYSKIRSLRGMSQDTGNTMRYVMPTLLYGSRFMFTGPGKTTGILDNRIGLSISGHLLGILAMYGSVDAYEWLRHLKTNFHVQDGRDKTRKDIQKAQKDRLLTEESQLYPFELHHGSEDEYATIAVAIAQHYVFDLPIPVYFIIDVLRYVAKLRRDRRLSEGQVGREFRRTAKPTVRVDWKPLV